MARDIDLDALFQKEAFKSIEEERLQAFKAFAADIKGKSTPEIMNLFMQNMQKLSGGRPVTGAERDAIICAIAESLPENDQKKLSSIVKMLGMMG